MKKNLLLSLFFFCLCISYTFAQTPPSWVYASSIGGSSVDDASDVTTDNAGNVYVIGSFLGTMEVGSFTAVSRGGKDIYVAKFTSSGSPVWLKTYGSTTDDVGFAITSNGTDIFWTGTFTNNLYYNASNFVTISGLPSETNLAIFRIDNTGSVVWAQKSGGEGILANYIYPRDIKTIPGGGVVVGGSVAGEIVWGTVASNGFIVKDTCYECGFISRYGSNTGAYEWTYTVRNILNPVDDTYASITQIGVDENHNVYAIGNMTSRNIGKPSKAVFPNLPLYGVGSPGIITQTGYGQKDMFLLKLGGDGLHLATQNGGYSVPPNYNYYTDGLTIHVDTTEDVIYMGGAFRDALAYTGMTGSINATGGNSFLFKTDLNGVLIWEKHTTTTNTNGGSGLWQLSGNDKGGVYIGISAQTDCDWYGHPAYGNTTDYSTTLLARIESNGNTRWTKTLDGGSFMFVNPPAMHAISSPTSDECWVAGTHNGFGIYFDAFLVSGNNFSFDGYIGKLGTSSPSSIYDPSGNLWQIYPNPASQNVWIKGVNPTTPFMDYQILDLQGKVVQAEKGVSSAFSLVSVQSIASGTYILEINQENKVIRTKLIVE